MLIPKFDLYKAEWLDLVFENRNKAYGAYDLRRHYSGNMMRAMAITIFGFAAVALTVTIVSRLKSQQPPEIIHEYRITPIKPPPIYKVNPVKPPKSVAPIHTAAAPRTVVIPTTITTDPQAAIDPPTKAEINTSVIGSEISKGTGPAVQPITPENTGDGGAGTGVDKSTEVILAPEVSPEPIGGMAGWSKFLQRNLRYPDTEVQGRVFVSFIVERDGALSNIQILKGVSPELDREALRVLKMAPKWKPGLQNNQPVRVQFNIPIVFQLN